MYKNFAKTAFTFNPPDPYHKKTQTFVAVLGFINNIMKCILNVMKKLLNSNLDL